jgi:phosphohistidine swiveling domain-containing protein
MNLVMRLGEVRDDDRHEVGGKGFALSRLARAGMRVPGAVCIPAEAYRQYVATTRLNERILFELNRKRFQDMRWEEIWDAALRIRNLFLTTPLPEDLRYVLHEAMIREFPTQPVAVRSSAPGEDSSTVSFAGLHESYVNVKNSANILDHIRLVWASLWSDRALMYRRELGLDVERSAMAVVVQELLTGDRSGVVFGESPNDEQQAVIEAVHGLNQGLVDGTVEPDRWILGRRTGRIISHIPATRSLAMVVAAEGVRLAPLPADKASLPPLSVEETASIYQLAMDAESVFGSPQDVEWTIAEERLFALQSRPITTSRGSEGPDERPWYLSLRRSFDNLQVLRRRIEEEDLPGMEAEAARLAQVDVSLLSDSQLAEEIDRRLRIQDQWLAVYRRDCIPFAHGMRLFGQFYNDAIHPTDPFEFVALLATSPMISVRRNLMLDEMASEIREDPALRERLERGDGIDGAFPYRLDAFLDDFGDLLSSLSADDTREAQRRQLLTLLLEMAERTTPPSAPANRDVDRLERDFLERLKEEKRSYGEALLELGRASYRLRDDDNTYLGRVEGQMRIAVGEGQRRLREIGLSRANDIAASDVAAILRGEEAAVSRPTVPLGGSTVDWDLEIKARQLTGQPAGPGIASGSGRVILGAEDLFQVRRGEVLVCDAIDPNMTFVVPLAAGIVERRGGMLIHGAIIAREYGIPCVTGVPNATRLIRTGDAVTVDGYLGIVTVG